MKSETTVARWYNFDGVVGQEMGGAGGVPSAATVQGAMNVCLDCITRGPKHVKISKRSKRIIFRYEIEEEKKEKKDTWQKKRRESNDEVDRHGTVLNRGRGEGVSSIAASPAAMTPPPVTPQPKAQAPADSPPVDISCSKAGGPPPAVSTPAGPPPATAVGSKPAGPPPPKGGATTPPKVKQGKHGKQGKAPPKSKQGARAKAKQGARGAPTTSTVGKKLVEVTRYWGSVMLQSKNLQDKITSDGSWQWANTDRFGGKLKRSIDRCHEALSADVEIHGAVMDNQELDDTHVTADINGYLSRIQAIYTALEAVETNAKRIRTLNEDDQPSQ